MASFPKERRLLGRRPGGAAADQRFGATPEVVVTMDANDRGVSWRSRRACAAAGAGLVGVAVAGQRLGRTAGPTRPERRHLLAGDELIANPIVGQPFHHCRITACPLPSPSLDRMDR